MGKKSRLKKERRMAKQDKQTNSDIVQPKTPNYPPVVEDNKIEIHDKTISFVVAEQGVCEHKCIVEFAPYFLQDGYQVTLTLQQNVKDVINICPRWVVMFRIGLAREFNNPNVLENTKNAIDHLRTFGVRVVYYLDDFVFYFNNSAPIEIAKKCDAIIVSTKRLEKLCNDHAPSVPIKLVPTHIDLPTFDKLFPLHHILNNKRFKVLLSSSGRIGANLLYNICEIANNRAKEFDDVQFIVNSYRVSQLRVLINAFRHLHKTYIDFISPMEYYMLYKSVDCVINPASNEDLDYLVPDVLQDDWLASKSELKYTISGAASIPLISSPMEAYANAIRNNETGFIVNSEEEFIEKILLLKNDATLRQQIGKAARADIEQRYDIRLRYPLYRNAIIGAV